MVLRLESPTRTLTLEAPRGVEVSAGVGDFTASCRKDLLLQSSEGEVSVSLHCICLCMCVFACKTVCVQFYMQCYVLLCWVSVGICGCLVFGVWCLEEKWKLEARVGDILNILNVLWTFPRTVVKIALL